MSTPLRSERLDAVTVRAEYLEPVGPASGLQGAVERHAAATAARAGDPIGVTAAVDVVQLQDADVIRPTTRAGAVAVLEHGLRADEHVLSVEVITPPLVGRGIAPVRDGA